MLSYVAATLGGTMVIRPQMSWVLWPGNALLVSVLLLVQRRVWPVLIAAAFAAFVLNDLQEGLPLRSIGLLILSDAVEVLVGALCLSYSFGGTPELNSVKDLVKYSFFGVFLAPFLGAFVGSIATEEEYWTSWGISFFAEALGFLIIVPTILVWVRKIGARGQKPRAYYLEASVLLAALVLVGYFIFAAPARSIPSALLYSIVPLLLWAALRFESVGVGTSVLVVAFLSIWGAVNGRGPFVESAPLNNVFSLQLFLFFTAGPFVFLAVLVEEKKDAGQALKKSEDKFSKAFRQSPMTLTLTSINDHRYIEVNETFERLTGWRREEVIGRTPFDIGLWVEPSQRTEFAKQLLTKASLRNLEVRFRTRNGEVLTGLASAELIEVNGEPCALSGVVDITDRKRAEEARQGSERRFAEFFTTLPEYCYMVSLGGQIFDVNPAACEAYGYTKDELIGKPVSTIYAPESHARMADLFEKWRKGETLHNEEMVIVTKNGKKRTVLLNVGSVKDAQGKFLYSASVQVDITERKLAEEALSSMSRRLIEAQEQERTRIARELHDDIDQRLALLSVNLGALSQNPPASKVELSLRITKELEMVTELARDVQALSHRLHSSKLEYLGLATAARSFCNEFSGQQEVEVDFHSDGVPRNLPSEISLCLFRVMQEALQNGMKHSGSRHFDVRLDSSLNEIQLSVSDSGIGFDLDEAMSGRGIGLSSMKERLKLVDGEFSIESKLQHGTTIRARVPLSPRIQPASAGK
jgi:PAS domain S-box-containing protein